MRLSLCIVVSGFFGWSGFSTASPPSFVIEREVAAPTDLRLASDVRWTGDGTVLTASSWSGAFDVDLSSTPLDLSPAFLPSKKGGSGPWYVASVAATDQVLLAAALHFEMRWMPRSGGSPDGEHIYREYIWDVDAQDDRVAILGADRGEDYSMAPDGAVVWLGSLGARLEDLRPLHYSADGPGARTMTYCAAFGLGALRFLADGKLVVVPGGEPGVFLYDRQGKLAHVWDTIELGADLVCDVSYEEGLEMAGTPEPRWEWMHRRSMIDDVIPLGDDPGLILRHPSPTGTRWELVVLSRSGPPQRIELPITSPSAFSHLEGDVRAGKIVFLQREDGRPENPVVAPPRWIVGRLEQVDEAGAEKIDDTAVSTEGSGAAQ